jgi:hypothetical protein
MVGPRVVANTVGKVIGLMAVAEGGVSHTRCCGEAMKSSAVVGVAERMIVLGGSQA